jgi:hypothetical protein
MPEQLSRIFLYRQRAVARRFGAADQPRKPTFEWVSSQ